MTTMAISASQVKELREKTGAGMMECKAALTEAGGNMEEAMTLLRKEARVLQVAAIREGDAIVVAGTADMVDRCEGLFRERDVLLRVADPHGPVVLEREAGAPSGTRVLRIGDADMRDTVTLLRAIYMIRERTESAEDGSVTVHATGPVLDAIEAVLGELELLVSTEVPAAS